MPDTLRYECPHCHVVVTVSSDTLGQTIQCEQCRKPFRADVPLARQVGGPPAPARPSRTDNEEVIKTIRPVVLRAHPFLAGLAGILILTGIVGLFFWMFGKDAWGMTGVTLLIVSLLGVLVAAALLAYKWLQAYSVLMTITNERTMVCRGILSKSTNEVQHSDVRNIQCNQNMMERLLNYGDISLSSAAQDGMEIVINDIPDPQSVVKLIRKHQ